MKQLGKDGFGIMVVVNGPLAGVDPCHPSCACVSRWLIPAAAIAVLVTSKLRVLGVRGHVLIGIGLAEQLVEQMLGPDDAVDRLRGSVSNRTAYSCK